MASGFRDIPKNDISTSHAFANKMKEIIESGLFFSLFFLSNFSIYNLRFFLEILYLVIENRSQMISLLIANSLTRGDNDLSYLFLV